MYSLILMAAMTAGANTPAWLFGHGCNGCWGGLFHGGHGCHGGCYGGGCYGGGCYGGGCYGGGCNGCYGGYSCRGGGCYGCYGTAYSGGCYGCAGYAPAHAAPAPAMKHPEQAPPPKKDEKSASAAFARLVIDLPADAKLYVDDQLMQTTSERREFRTPTLERGQAYYYILRAEVARDGKTLVDTKRVIVRSGDVLQESFRELGNGVASRAQVNASP